MYSKHPGDLGRASTAVRQPVKAIAITGHSTQSQPMAHVAAGGPV